MILRNLWHRKVRTVLTVLGVAIGVAAVISLSAFGEGFATGFEKTFSATRADLTVSQKDALMVFLSALDEDLGGQIRATPGVDEVSGTVVGLLQMPGVPYFIVKGEDPRGFTMRDYAITEGRPIGDRREILLGRTAAASFRKRLGDVFELKGTSYRVVGIYQTGVAFEDGGAVIRLDDAQSAFDKPRQVSYYSVKLKDARRIDDVKKTLESRYTDVVAARSGEATKQDDVLKLYRSFGWLLGIFAILVGGLGMMNSTLMSVFERTREIGVLRALGWSRRRVVGLILGETLVLALAGAVLGLALGSGLTALVRLSPAVASLLQGVFTPSVFAPAVVLALGLGAIGGLYPAWRASRLLPAEAMRYEGGAAVTLGRRTEALARRFGGTTLRNLFRRPTRTLLSGIGIGLGVGFLAAMIALTGGLESTFVQLASGGQADLMAEQAGISDISSSRVDARVVERLRRDPEVAAVSGVVLGTTIQPGAPFLLLFGLDPSEEFIDHYRVREGRLVQRPREIMLGRFAANSLRKAVGDKFRLGGTTYTVVGIYENGVAWEDISATLPLSDAQQFFGKPGKLTFLAIRLRDLGRAEEVGARLEKQYPGVQFSQPAQATSRMQDFASTKAMLGVLVALTVLVGGMVMMDTMLMSVFERTQELGVLRAVGWSRRRIVRLVLGESLALSFLAAVFGLLFGFLLSNLVRLDPSIALLLAPKYSVDMVAGVTLLALALGGIGGLYPAWRASGLRPVEALRYE